MDWVELLFSKDGAYAAVGVAAIAAVGWIAKTLIEWVQRINDRRRKKREYIIQFYNDVTLRVENCTELINSGNRHKIKAVITNIETRGGKFRGYITQVIDFSVYTNLLQVLHSLGDHAIYHCSKYMTLDRLVVLQADKLESDAFANLSLQRKLAVIDVYYNRVEELARAGRAALVAIEYLPGYADIDQRYRQYAARSGDQSGQALASSRRT